MACGDGGAESEAAALTETRGVHTALLRAKVLGEDSFGEPFAACLGELIASPRAVTLGVHLAGHT